MSRSRSRGAARRFGLRSLARFVLGVALPLGGEAYLFTRFQPHDPRVGWLTHFFIGISVGLVAMTVWLVEERRAVPLPGLWLVLGHLLALFPDVLFSAGVVHQHWMDGFLGHLISHRVAGGNVAWYVVFLATLAVYLAFDLRTRTRQSAGGRRRRRA